MDASLGIAPQARAAISGLQYGNNTKTMFQFGSTQPFAALGGDGTAYAADPMLPNVQVAFTSKTPAPGADPERPSEPNALGSYTCNQPGYFTTMEGWLGEPAGNLTFAGSTPTASTIFRASSRVPWSRASAPS
jgi:hypothetical protein